MRAWGAGVFLLSLGVAGCSGGGDDTTTSTSTATTPESASTAVSTSTAAPSPTSSTSISTPRPTASTTYSGPRDRTADQPEDCSFPTAFGSPVPGKELSGVTCKAAHEVWRRYLALPPDPAAGSSNRRELDDGWTCYTPTTRTAADRDEGGICERAAEGQRFVLRHR